MPADQSPHTDRDAGAGYSAEVAPAHRRTESGACQSCATVAARRWNTPDGPAMLCVPCATLFGLGCP